MDPTETRCEPGKWIEATITSVLKNHYITLKNPLKINCTTMATKTTAIDKLTTTKSIIYIYIYIYVCVCVCVCTINCKQEWLECKCC
jgi:hypothetical protein